MHIAFPRQKWLRVPDTPGVPIEFNFIDISLLRLLVGSYLFSDADTSHIRCRLVTPPSFPGKRQTFTCFWKTDGVTLPKNSFCPLWEC